MQDISAIFAGENIPSAPHISSELVYFVEAVIDCLAANVEIPQIAYNIVICSVSLKRGYFRSAPLPKSPLS